MRAGTGGFAQTPDVLSRLQPGRKRVSLQKSATRREAVFARPAGPSAHKSGSGVIFRQEHKPSQSSWASGQRSARRRRRRRRRAVSAGEPGTSLPGRGPRGRDPTTAPPQGRWGGLPHRGEGQRGTQTGWGGSAGVSESPRPKGPGGACLHPPSHPPHPGYRAPGARSILPVPFLTQKRPNRLQHPGPPEIGADSSR